MAAREKLVVSTTTTTTTSRLKREDCNRTKHDSAFSRWKILIGPSDWEEHLLRKEGAEKYKTHNLPNCSSCPGVYELGIVLSHPRSGREVGKLDPDRIIPVYVGQADNVRSRLQHYGREGAHLENGHSNGELNGCKDVSGRKGPGLFTDIFSRGFSIVYRWAPMKSKRDAEKTEAQLLDKFDYAWNKGSNGARRPDDILQRLDRSTSSATQFAVMARKLQIFRQKQGVRIEVCKPLLLENSSNHLLSRILKFGMSQPRLVSFGFGVNEDHTGICGVALGHGSVCIRPPVEGRKRCAEHKGMKINGSIPKLITEGNSPANDVSMGSGIIRAPECDGHQDQKFSYSTPQLGSAASRRPVNEDFSAICGVSLDDGSPCKRGPVPGRKRCEEHKGRKIHRPISEEKKNYVHGPVLESRARFNDYEQIAGTCKPDRLQSQVYSNKSGVNKSFDTVCGVDLEDGTFCTRQPVAGRKRCEEHKWMRVNEPMSKLFEADIPSVFVGSGMRTCNDRKYNNTSGFSISYKGVVNKDSSPTCGATLQDGSFCRRKPTEGNKRCWQHKGMKVGMGSGMSTCNDWICNGTSSPSASYRSFVSEDFSSTCVATTLNGSRCRRPPAKGRNRCWQH